jgi:hypothetical protein
MSNRQIINNILIRISDYYLVGFISIDGSYEIIIISI